MKGASRPLEVCCHSDSYELEGGLLLWRHYKFFFFFF